MALKFKCNYCEVQLSKSRLFVHVKKFHPEKINYNYKCQICEKEFQDLRAILVHVTRNHTNEISTKEYYNKYIYGTLRCKFCNEILPYERYSGNFCNALHYTSYIRQRNGLVNSTCKICGLGFKNDGGLQHHLNKVHHYNLDSLEEYYKKYIWKECESDGNCKWCGKKLKWISFTEGYQDFCYNTDCNVRWYNQNTDRKEKAAITNSKTMIYHPEKNHLRKEYWMKKGYSEKESVDKVRERQSTFTKEKCIEKYGEVEGLKKWQERQDKWQNTLNNKPIEERERINRAKLSCQGFSRVSQKLFWDVYNKYPDKEFHFYFAENGTKNQNNEYALLTKNNSWRFLDFYSPECNKLIEFDGDYWHGDKQGNKERDRIREEEIKESLPNIQIYHVKECEYRKNIIKTVNDCLEFLNDKKD
jgi:uncharacterized C2H2 Zn-finger protein